MRLIQARTRMQRLIFILLSCCVLTPCAPAQNQGLFGQKKTPLVFGNTETTGSLEVSAKLVPVDAATVDVQVTVKLPEHHYIYSMDPSFSAATTLTFVPSNGASLEADGPVRPDREPKRAYDKDMKQDLEKFYDQVTWTQRMRSTTGSLPADLAVSGELNGMYCSTPEFGGTCRPIRPAKSFTATLPEGYRPSAENSPVPSPAPIESSATVTVVPEMRLAPGKTQPPIRFTVSLTPQNAAPGEYVRLTVKADIDQPYHTYSITQDPETLGATPTSIVVQRSAGARPTWDTFRATQSPELKQLKGFEGNLEVHHDTVEWNQEYVVTGDAVDIEGTITFQVCNDTECMPPAEAEFRVGIGSQALVDENAATPGDSTATFGGDRANADLIPFIVSAIGFGFVALLTPCVFPMIPVTISYFLKQGNERPGTTIKLAVIYCVGIVGAFTVLGLLLAALFGPTALNQLANNKWLNLAFAAIFAGFALMLMGMFELRVPSWLLTWSSKKQEGGGVVGVLFMALTFTLVSFTCTFAFVGQLVVWASQGDFTRPIIGMVAFSTAFASPFFFLSLFPSLLARMPKSGGWMNSVKVTMGLLELAVVTKFLSVADTGFSPTGMPRFLDYHLVMGSWIAVALVTGVYLLGLFRMPHDSPNETIGPVRCLFSLGFIGLAAYIAVGLFSPQPPAGVLWQQIVAFAPPQIEYSTDGDDYFIEHDGLKYALDFDAAVETASTSNMPMFLDFTGVNCINCRLMEKGVLASPKVHAVLADMVRVQLYVDEVPGVKQDAAEHQRLLTRNHALQSDWFGDVSIPAYVIATPDGQEILAAFKGLDDSAGDQFQQFLTAGLARWEELNSTASVATADVSTASFSR